MASEENSQFAIPNDNKSTESNDEDIEAKVK